MSYRIDNARRATINGRQRVVFELWQLGSDCWVFCGFHAVAPGLSRAEMLAAVLDRSYDTCVLPDGSDA
jgi:hypothetical protein